MSICKRCGIHYYTSQPLCPKCTEHYQLVYDKSNLSQHPSKVKIRYGTQADECPLSLRYSFVAALIYFFFILYTVCSSFVNITSDVEIILVGVLSLFLYPSVVLMFIGLLLHIIAFISLKKSFILAAAILYIISGAMSIIFLIPWIIISLVMIFAYLKIKST